MFSFNQPNCITALPRPEKAHRRIQNDQEESQKRRGMVCAQEEGWLGVAAARHSQCPTEIFGGACRSVGIIDCPTSSSPSIRGSGGECESRVRPGDRQGVQTHDVIAHDERQSNFHSVSRSEGSTPLLPPSLPPSLTRSSSSLTTFPTSSFPSLTPFAPPPRTRLDKIFSRGHT